MKDYFILSYATSFWSGELTTIVGGLLIYLSSPNQSLLLAPLGRDFRIVGGGLLTVGLAAFLAGLGVPAALASWGVALMLTLLVTPFLSLLKGPRT